MSYGNNLGDCINVRSINTTQPDYPFDTETLIVTTGSPRASADVKTAFLYAGVDPNIFNVEMIPNLEALGISPLGLGPLDSKLITIFRIAACEDPIKCNTYMNHEWKVIRATPKIPKAFETFGLPPYINRTSLHDESSYTQPLQALISKVVSEHTQKGAVLLSNYSLLTTMLDGWDCIKERRHCALNSRDGVYMLNHVALSAFRHKNPSTYVQNELEYVLSDDPDDCLIIVGVIHSKLPIPMATYTSVTLYEVSRRATLMPLLDTDLIGSAHQYGLSANHFYAYKIKRDCNKEQWCFTLPDTVPLSSKIKFCERSFLNPQTNTGPDPKQLIPPTILHFSKKN